MTTKVCTHSKPFWNKLHTEASTQLWNLRKVYKNNFSPRNGIALERAKEFFKNPLLDSAADWMSEHLGDLGHRKQNCLGFLQKITGTQRAGVEQVNNQKEEIFTTAEDIAMEFRRKFFATRHLQNQIFDNNHFNMINHDVQKLPECTQHELLGDDITGNEIDTAVRNGTQCSSMDNDEFHSTLFKHIGPKFMSLLLQLYNECWQKSNWPWFKARILFIRKPNKESYLLCSSFRPLSISSHNGKLSQRVVEQRLMKWLEASNCINLTQDGFRPKKSTARSLYLLNI